MLFVFVNFVCLGNVCVKFILICAFRVVVVVASSFSFVVFRYFLYVVLFVCFVVFVLFYVN